MGDAVSAVDLAGLAAAGDRPGALWRLDGEELQANLIRLGLGDRIQPHRNDEVEVLMVVVAGQGELTLTAGSTRSPPWPWFTCPRGRSGGGGGRRAACLPVGPPPPTGRPSDWP